MRPLTQPRWFRRKRSRRPMRAPPSPRELRRIKRRNALARISDVDDKIAAYLCAIDRGEAVYDDQPGEVYSVCRLRAEDGETLLDIKVGIAEDTSIRQADYDESCDPVEFLWLVKWKCERPKLLERLVHLTFHALGAALPTDLRTCAGCGVRHREFFAYEAVGGIDGVSRIVEFWLGVLGEPVERILLSDSNM
ncbi:hypothetical protein MSAN_02322900 [Mycena sanguinolenta]|uniref:Bacteriophage T5 Orf172 DNA-binding domain-containing protein n=1 Tax=Mycena sanguinolenta TaxID=230812 RepID=A0A8H6X8C6_9AGAR|nr:hypothetical protein MSAN_02494600 [Mycena sanguinolenta]KAF7336089.1 hypothetical protein MSAN_02322900 [Mycena sanguinolenta]